MDRHFKLWTLGSISCGVVIALWRFYAGDGLFMSYEEGAFTTIFINIGGSIYNLIQASRNLRKANRILEEMNK